MMQTQLIAAYEQLLEQTKHLLECAKKADWDGLFALKSQGLIDAAYLRRAQDKVELDDGARQYQMDLMRQILALEKQVQGFLHTRQNDLGELMQINRTKSDLNNAYRSSSSTVIPISHYLYRKK